MSDKKSGQKVSSTNKQNLRVPNSVVLMTDQHRVDTIGALGSDSSHTPVLDSFMEEGFAFTQAYTPTAICTPARASLLTGQAPFRHRVLANHEWNIAYCSDLTPDQWTYSQFLRDQGYNVGIIGKFHAGEVHLPDEFGYDDDSFVGAINPVANPRYVQWLKDHGYPPVRMTDPIQGTLPGDRPGHVLAARLQMPLEATFERFITELAIERLRQYAKDYRETGKPFTLDVHYYGPHLPYIIPDEYFDLIDPDTITLPASFNDNLFNKPQIQSNYATYWSTDSFDEAQWRKLIAIYRGYVAMIDHELGIIREEMARLGIEDSTAIFFTADHGEFTGAHRMNDKGPAMYEDIYNIPLLAHIPGIDHRGQCDEFVSLLDIPATILDLAGFDPSLIQDGRSFVDLTRGDEVPDWRKDIVLEFHGHHFPYQQRALRTRRYKLVFNPADVNEFYDLELDPNELTNLWTVRTYDEVRREVAKELHRQLVERGDDVFAKWMAAMMDFDVPLGGTSKSDYDDVEVEDKPAGGHQLPTLTPPAPGK